MMVIEPASVLHEINDFRKANKYCDLVVNVDNNLFPCHRVVLAASVTYFDKLLNSHFSEKDKDTVELKNVDPIGFGHILDYIYMGDVCIDDTTVKHILSVATFLGIECLSKKCTQYIVENINLGNAIDYLLFSIQYGVDRIQNHVADYIVENFLTLSQTEKFFEIPFGVLQQLISDDDIDIENEKNVYESVMKWIDHNPSERSQYVTELMKCVRFRVIESDYVLNHVLRHPLVLSSLDTIRVVSDNQVSEYTSRLYEKCIYVFGTQKCGEHFETVALRYNTVSFKEAVHMRHPFATEYLKVAVSHKCIYKFTYNIFFTKNTFFCYNFHDRSWLPLKLPDTILSMYNMVSMDSVNSIYFNTSMRSIAMPCHDYNVYSYITDLDKWYTVASSGFEIGSASLVNHNNVIYSCGGLTESNFYKHTNHLLLYDPRIGKWINKHPLPNKIAYTAGACLNDKIYIAGGWEAGHGSNKVQIYDIVADKWNYGKSMLMNRYSHSLITYQNKLWAIGGAAAIETYDPSSNLWVYQTSIDFRGTNTDATVY